MSNLLLIVINKIDDATTDSPVETTITSQVLSTEPKEMETGLQYGVVHPCHKKYMNELYRRRLEECFVSKINIVSEKPFYDWFVHLSVFFHKNLPQTEHPDEEETAYCGLSSRIKFSLLLILLPMFCLVRFSLE